MRIVRAAEVAATAAEELDPAASFTPPHWLAGPTRGDGLDVGIVSLGPGQVTPPHIHLGGQVMVVLSGRGFVDVDGERAELEAGDVVIAPAGERHTHGATDTSPVAHLTITTGDYDFGPPDDPG